MDVAPKVPHARRSVYAQRSDSPGYRWLAAQYPPGGGDIVKGESPQRWESPLQDGQRRRCAWLEGAGGPGGGPGGAFAELQAFASVQTGGAGGLPGGDFAELRATVLTAKRFPGQ